MSTPRLDHIAATGQTTGVVRLADGTTITVNAGPGTSCLPCPGVPGPHGVPADYAGPYTHVEVYLPEGVEPGDTDRWGDDDAWELRLTAGDKPANGRLFHEVPVDAVRELIEEHGGEHPEQDI